MHTNPKKLVSLCFFPLFASGILFANAESVGNEFNSPYIQDHMINGSCGLECKCGCMQGKPCTCFSYDNNVYQSPVPKPAYRNNDNTCGSDCDCGCMQGQPCTCSPSEEEGQAEQDESCCDHRTETWIYSGIYPTCCECDNNCCGIGVWLPECPPLFRPFVADPRAVNASAGWRLNDQVLVKNVIDVSYGDNVPFYRFCNVWGGQLQIEVEGALWAVFDPLHDSSPLINADYYVGFPITYAFDRWSFRLRGYHISSHIGDEFLLDHPFFVRKNPSAEYLDFYASYWPTHELRVYGGVGVILHEDESFRMGRVYGETGAEVHLSSLGFVSECQNLYGRPYFGMDFRFQTKQNRHINQTYVLGYEFGKLTGLEHVFRAYLEYHDGYSYEGQFWKFPTNYFSVRISYGY